MKIHLPKGLRQVLLASLAAVAVPATLSTTVGTASGIAAAMYVASQEAQAVENPPAEAPRILPIAVTQRSTSDKDANHRQLIGEEVTYSGDIYTWNVSQHTSFHGNQGNGQFTPWIQNGDGSGMTDGETTTSGTGDFWKHFVECDKNGDTLTYDTLRLVGATGAITLDTHGMSSTAGSKFGLGGLIVEEGGSYTIDVAFGADNANPMALYWGAGEGETCNKFEALILSDVTFTGIRDAARSGNDGEVYGFHIISDADIRIAKGKTLEVQSILQIADGKAVTLSSVGDASAVATFRVNSIDVSAATPGMLTVGDGVNMEVTEGVTGTLGLTLGANAEFSIGSGSLTLSSLVLTGDEASLAMTLAQGTQLTLQNFTDNGHILTIHIDGLTADMLGETGFDLFGEGWNADWLSKIVIDGDIKGKRVKLNEQGNIVLTDEILIHDEDGLNAIIGSENQAGKEWYIDIDPSEDNVGNGVYFNPGTISANVNLLQTLKINNGSSNNTVTFSGVLRSEAGANFEYAWSGGTNVTYAFTGDLTEFHGDMVVTEAGNEVTFSFGTTTGDGAITNEGGTGEGSLKVALNGTTVNATVHANDLSVAGNVTLNKNVTITDSTVFNTDSTLTLATGSQVNLGGVVSGTLSALTLNSDSSLTLQLGNGSLLSFSIVTGEGSLTIDISGLGDFITYQLLDPSNMSWYETWKDKLQFIGKEGVTLNEHGMLVTGDFNTDYGTPTPAGTTQDVSDSAWYTGVTGRDGTDTPGQTFNVGEGANLKLSNTYNGGAEPSPKLNFTGAIESLYFTRDPGAKKGAFHFGDDTGNAWTMGDGVTIGDIYIDNAELFLQCEVNFGNANVHVSGLTDSNAYEGTIRAHSNKVTIGGNLIVEGDALISVQGGGEIEVGGQLTGTGELIIGSYGSGTVTLKQGGTLEGDLAFRWDSNVKSTGKLVIEKGAETEASTALNVYGLVTKDGGGGQIVAGGEGQGTATLTLTGTGEYTYRGTIGTDTAPTTADDGTVTGWTDESSLNLVINLVGGGEEMGIAAGGATGTQTILGNVHVNNLTVSGGTLIVPTGTSITVQVDGDMVISGTGKFAFGESGNCESHLIVNDLTIDNLDDSSREAFFTEGKSTTLIKGQFRANGSIGTYGNITFEQGGELSGTLRYGWSGGITLGGDLTVGGLERGVEGGTHINKLESTEGTVYLLHGFTEATEATFDSFYNNLKSWGTIGEGIGFGKAGEGKLTLTGGGTVGYDFKVAGGELSLGEGTWTFEKGLTGGVGETKSTLSIGGGVSIGGSLTGNLDITSTATSGDETADWEQRNVWVDMNGSGESTLDGTVTFGEGVGLKKSGTGKLTVDASTLTDNTFGADIWVTGGLLEFTGSSLTLNGDIKVENGQITGDALSAGLSFANVDTVTVNGELTVTGDIVFYGSSSRQLTLKKGGKITGTFLASWGPTITLGADLEVGGFAGGTQSNNPVRSFTRYTGDDATVPEIVYILLNNSGDVSETSDAFCNSIKGGGTIGDGVGIGKTGVGTLNFTGGGTIAPDFKVAGGTLALDANAYTFSKSLTVTGEGSALTAGAGLTVTGIFTVTDGAAANVTGQLLTGGNGEDHVTIETLVSAGGQLTVGSYLTARNTLVTGEGSSMTINGDATLNTWANLTVDDGASVTINGTLSGNKTGAGDIYVGSYDSANQTTKSGTLTLGEESGTNTHKANGLKVYGTGSTLTVNGNLTTYGYDGVTQGTIAGLEIMYGATATVNGNLICGNGNDVHSALVLGGEGNTGTLTVTGTLSAGDVTVEGEGSALTVKGATATLETLAGNGSVSGANITVTGSTDANSAKVFSGTLEKDTKVTLSEGGHWTLGEGFSGAGATVVVGGTLNVNNVQAPSEDSGTANLGTVEITSTGTLEVGAGSNMKVGTMKLADGTSEGAVTVTDGSALTVGNVSGTGQLTSLTLDSDANLTINSGDLAIAGTLTWGSGAKLTLGDSSEQKLTWSADCFTSETKDGALTVHLSDEYLNGLEFGQDSFLNLEELTWSSDWSEQFTFETDEASNYKNVHLDENGHLVWESNGVEWSEPEGGKWLDLENWKEAGAEPPAVKVEGRNVFFYALGDATGETSIEIDGEVAPINVYVKSGNYAFTGGGLNITGEGVLSVGGDEEQTARLTLRNTNTSIPTIELRTNGTLVLDSDGALTSTDSGATKLQFLGGTLEIGEGLTNTDVSNYVDAEGSTAAVKINVGSKDVTWGSAETGVSGNGGLTLILDEKGLEKTGTGNFTLAWKETEETERRGALKVAEGTLTLDVTAEVGASLTGGATVEQGAILDLKASGAGVNMGSVSGAGTLKVSQGEVTLSGNNTVSAIELAGGNTTLGSDTALGGADTVLTLSGGGIASGSASAVNAGTVRVTDGKETTVSGTVTFSGEIGGGGTLRAGGGATLTLSGSVNGFNGKLDTGDGTMVLRGEALSGDDTNHLIQTTVCGNGTVEFAGNATYGGTVEGGVTLKSTVGSELLVLSTQSSTGAKLEGSITLGNAGTQAQWNGAAVTGGTITLANVKLSAGGLSKQGEATIIVDTAMPAASDAQTVSAAPTGGVVDVSGMDAGMLDGIRVNANGQLKGVVGTYAVGSEKTLTLHFTTENSSETEGDPNARALIEGTEFTVELNAGNAADHGLQLGFDADMAAWFRTHDELYLHVLGSGTWETEGVTLDWTQMTDEVAQLMDIVVGGNYQFTADGLKLTGSTKDLYLVTGEETGDPGVSNTPADLKDKLATVVTNEQTLTLNWAEDGTVNNLFGTEGTALDIKNVTGSGITVTFDNTKHDPIRDDRYPDSESGKGQDTTFEGSITGSYGVDIVKVGTGTLTVGGDYTLKNGDTRIEAGALRLRGEKNTMESLTFAYGSAPGEGEQRGLLLENGQTTIGSIVEAADAETTEGNEVNLTHGAGLTLTGQSTLANTGITGDKSGTLELADGVGLSFTGAKGITDVAVNLDGERSTLDLGTTQSTLPSLNGKGTLRSSGVVNVSGGTFSGTLDGEGGTLAVTDGASFTLDNARSTAAPDGGGGGMNVRLGNGSRLTIDVSKKSGTSDDTLVLGDIDLGNGHVTVDYGDKSIAPHYVQGNIIDVGKDGTIEFHSTGPVADGKRVTGFSVEVAGSMKDFIDEHVKFTGLGNFMKDHSGDVDENGNLVITTTESKENKFDLAIPGAGKNAHAGAALLGDAFRKDAVAALLENPTSQYAQLIYALVSDIENERTAGLPRTYASVAGAAISTLGPALAQDVHRQLTTIRNRTTMMSADAPSAVSDKLPYWHAWIQAEGGYHKMDADGTAPGFTLNNWGGTVGVDADISRATTMGLAVTAMYGDLKPDAADSATGDLDTVYLSAFARTMHGAWCHTFAVSAGMVDAKLDRTVSHSGGSYHTSGSTDGYAFGVLYEVGYTKLTGKNGTLALQPIANVELRHVTLDGYSETGSDAGLNVDDIEQTVLTFGAGARIQAAVGENAFNRTSVLEARLLAKADVGDRSGTATNAIVGHSKRAEVESAEVGAVGIETGIGISIPLGSHSGSIFADASLEWRDNWVSTNATLGYRINF